MNNNEVALILSGKAAYQNSSSPNTYCQYETKTNGVPLRCSNPFPINLILSSSHNNNSLSYVTGLSPPSGCHSFRGRKNSLSELMCGGGGSSLSSNSVSNSSALVDLRRLNDSPAILSSC